MVKQVSMPLSKKLLGAAIALSFLTSACGGKEEAAGPKAIPVKLETLETATLIDSTTYVGTLEARKRVNLAPTRTNGRIVKIYVEQGDVVRKGQKLVEIQPTQQKEDVRAATGELNVAKAQLGEAEANWRAAEADRAEAAADVERARADLEDAKAEVILADVDYKRWQFLAALDVRTQQELDEKRRDFYTKTAQEDSRARTLKAQQEALRAAEKRVEVSLANVNSRKASIVRAEGNLGRFTEELQFNFIVAPIDGVVGSLNRKKVGDSVDVGEQVTTITDNKIFYLNVRIPTEYRTRLKLGLPVEIVNPDGSIGVSGRVTFIEPLVDQSTQAILTKMEFKNDGTLRDDQYVQVRVIWKERPGLLVPTKAVTSLGGQKFVFVAEEGESEDGEPGLVAKQKAITAGTIQGQAYQVISGLKEGDRIALNRILDLKDGLPVTEESLTSEKTDEQ